MTEQPHTPPPHTASADSLNEFRNAFLQLAESAADAGSRPLMRATAVMMDLLAVAELFADDESTRSRADELLGFCREQALPQLGGSEAEPAAERLVDEATERWGECFDMLSPDERFQCQSGDWSDAAMDEWNQSADASSDESSESGDEPALASIDVAGILESLGPASAPAESADGGSASPSDAAASGSLSQDATPAPRSSGGLPRPPRGAESIDDPELLAAYTDDAQLCLTEMEGTLLNLEQGQADDETLRNFCRQLHTLKGASGTVGLSRMAGYLHDVESWLESQTVANVSVDTLLECVDAVRDQLAALGVTPSAVAALPHAADDGSDAPSSDDSPRLRPEESSVSGSQQTSAAGGVRAAGRTAPAASTAENELFVRVDASRLERLMDLLAELVMLRNRRDSHVDFLRNVHEELNLCAVRARTLTTNIDQPDPSAPAESAASNSAANGDARRQTSHTRFLTRSLDEVARDTAELSRSLREVFDPLAADNSAVSHLIGRFRQELMELRRLPVSGLFQRLQRAIRDAARAEGKQVEIHFEGQGARAERALQERLFEPLLHLVRNAVSHGIQSPEEREQQGLPTAGRITLAAWSDAASLCIEVRDDGRGLNDSALESRGRELGLLPPGESVSRAQIRKLIFHPGFSTKSTVSEISGRGVGMDVVDNWVRRLRGRIDVESTAGSGTTFRLQIPLRSAVEHAMIVRAGRQLYALPMHAVASTADSKRSRYASVSPDTQIVQLSQVLGLPDEDTPRSSLITLRETVGAGPNTSRQPGHHHALAVDAIVGVEEVVVRSLPSLLQRNELFVGVTLSGRAETVLLLDAARLLELIHSADFESDVAMDDADQTPAADDVTAAGAPFGSDAPSANCVLIVDDSIVVRRSLTRKLTDAGFAVREAGNGQAALRILRTGEITAVVTDVDMPEMSGAELLREMKRHKQMRSIPVAVLSSRDEESMPNEVRELRPAVILAKPVTDETITALLETFALSGSATA